MLGSFFNIPGLLASRGIGVPATPVFQEGTMQMAGSDVPVVRVTGGGAIPAGLLGDIPVTYDGGFTPKPQPMAAPPANIGAFGAPQQSLADMIASFYGQGMGAPSMPMQTPAPMPMLLPMSMPNTPNVAPAPDFSSFSAQDFQLPYIGF